MRIWLCFHNRKMFKLVMICKSSAKLELKYSDTPSMVP